MSTLTDLNLTAESWTQTHDGVEVTFYRMQMPSCSTYDGKWLAWAEASTWDVSPVEFTSQPTKATVESLYTG